MEDSIMAYATEPNRLISMMLGTATPTNQSHCQDCSLYQPNNHYHGSCRHRLVALAQDPSCYQAQVNQTSLIAREPVEPYGNSSLDIQEPDTFEEPDYALGTMTSESMEEMAAQFDLAELADLGRALDEYLRLNDHQDTPPEALQSKLRSIQQQMVNIAADMGFVKFTPELYEQLYGKQ
jgi:hypothetical protein